MGLLNVLCIPIILLNFFGGIVAGIWLLVMGEWNIVLVAVLGGVISTLVVGYVMLPSALLVIPGFAMIKKGTGIFGHLLLFCGSLYIIGVLWYWTLFVFGYFTANVGPQGEGIIPLLLMSYSVATAPVGYMASKEGDSAVTMIAALSVMLGCMLLMLSLMFGFHPGLANLIFLAVLAIGLFAQLVTSVQIATAMRVDEGYYE